MTGFWCEHAWLDTGVRSGVRITVSDGRITSVAAGVAAVPGDHRLAGLVLPGLADAHSHAFHRALRGRTHDGGGTFWTWRQAMYAVADRLDPDRYLALARAAYAEMVLAGVTCVGEFHYLHHGPGGRPYADANAMSSALVQAAADAGLRLTLLDTCYVTGGLDADGHTPLSGVQRRFADPDAEAWAARVAALPERAGVRVGVAAHSVRAVPAGQLAVVAAAAVARPLHVHVSEQQAENDACQAHYGGSPAALLGAHGVLGEHTTVVHGTHLSGTDVGLVASSGAAVCACPSTEADLADGLGPWGPMRDAGVPLCLGSDQHVQTDLIAEAQLLESHERLRTGRRGTFAPAELVDALTAVGHRALGWPDAGRLEVGARADLVAVALDSPRTAGVAPAQAVLAAGAGDVRTVVVDGRAVVAEGRHHLGDVGRLLAEAIEPLWEES